MATGWTYLLHNGGLRSLVALASTLAAAPRPRIALIHVHDGWGQASARLQYVHRQAEHFTIRQVIELNIAHDSDPTTSTAAPPPGAARFSGRAPQNPTPSPPLLRPRIVLAALAHTAAMHGERLIWPAQFNGDFALITAVTEQLVLLRHLLDLEPAAGPRPIIETPLIDLTDLQIIELGSQLDVPWRLAWSCLLHHDQPCRMCPPCRQRQAAFSAASIIDPVEQLLAAER